MTTAPNIEMIAALLRSCRVGRERGIPSPAVGVVGEGGGGVAVELNSETVLPFHWEQCLDMQTGEVYYFNRDTGTRTSKDPRVAAAAAAAHAYSSSYLSEEDASSSSDSFSGVSNGNSRDDTNEDSVDSTANSCLTSISSASSPATAAEPLVSAGCRFCFMYFMVPKSDDACPKCGGRLFKLGRHGNA